MCAKRFNESCPAVWAVLYSLEIPDTCIHLRSFNGKRNKKNQILPWFQKNWLFFRNNMNCCCPMPIWYWYFTKMHQKRYDLFVICCSACCLSKLVDIHAFLHSLLASHCSVGDCALPGVIKRTYIFLIRWQVCSKYSISI